MDIFDDFYRPDTPSQRWRLLAVSVPAFIVAGLAMIPPLVTWLAESRLLRVGSRIVATGLDLLGSKPPYPSAFAVAQTLLIGLALVALLRGVGLQIQVLRQFAPQSQTLKLAQRILLGYACMLLLLAWPTYQLITGA